MRRGLNASLLPLSTYASRSGHCARRKVDSARQAVSSSPSLLGSSPIGDTAPPRESLDPKPPVRRKPQGGLVTTRSGTWWGTHSAASPLCSDTQSSAPMRLVSLSARLNAPSCTSLPMSRPFHCGRARSRASCTAAAHACLSKSGHRVQGQSPSCRDSPGAWLRAMSSASSSSVPLPHMGSASTASAPSLVRSPHPASSSTPAAAASLSGDLCMASR
mmetsp:Transcript_3143/g.7864  ORF Transcript_3143/g.7864 Transcript_3143/m.7864 type:complete len:217 (-) Transcript_3143:1323-1973(-)